MTATKVKSANNNSDWNQGLLVAGGGERNGIEGNVNGKLLGSGGSDTGILGKDGWVVGSTVGIDGSGTVGRVGIWGKVGNCWRRRHAAAPTSKLENDNIAMKKARMKLLL